MKKNAYHYLFEQDTLYQAVEPEPVEQKHFLPEPPAIQPEQRAEQTRAETKAEPVKPERSQPVAVAEPAPIVAAMEPVSDPTPSLVIDTLTPTPVAPKPKVMILIDEELTPGELIFLENILKAIHLNLDEIDILNLAGSGLVDFHAVLENKTIHHFISFGVPFKTIHLAIQMDRYQPIRIFGINFLLADPLSAIETDLKLKRKLWEVLRKIFLD